MNRVPLSREIADAAGRFKEALRLHNSSSPSSIISTEVFAAPTLGLEEERRTDSSSFSSCQAVGCTFELFRGCCLFLFFFPLHLKTFVLF